MALRFFRKDKPDRPDQDTPGDTGDPEVPASEPETDSSEPEEDGPVPQPAREPEPTSESGDPADRKTPGFFGRLRVGLQKTRDILTTDIDDLFLGKREIDDEMLEELEELLITSDIGVQTAMTLMERIAKQSRKISGPDALKSAMQEEILSLIGESADDAAPGPPPRPFIVTVLGVNGVGKTTTIGKLAARAAADGKHVLIAAADTFRAAAVEQLSVWAERAGADIIRHKEGADPAAVAYDSIEAALARKADVVLIDTAGRLHTKVNLMEELKKIHRSVEKKLPGAPHEVLLVLDATTGQNALSQATMFNDELGVTALALTKLDGTAKGGIVVSICSQLQIPLKYIGVGEKIDDLQTFDPRLFVSALFD